MVTKTKTVLTKTEIYVELFVAQLVKLFFKIEKTGATFGQFFTKTIPSMRKTNNPFVWSYRSSCRAVDLFCPSLKIFLMDRTKIARVQLALPDPV